MEFYKIEIHTTESDFGSLNILKDEMVEFVSGLDLQHHSFSSTQSSQVVSESESDDHSAPVKLEVYTSSDPRKFIEKFRGLDHISTIHAHPCKPLSLLRIKNTSVSDTVEGSLSPPESTPPPPVDSATNAFRCTFDRRSENTVILKVEAPMSPLFLDKITSVLVNHDTDILNARKFRQGESDIATFTLANIPETQIELIHKQLIRTFDSATPHTDSPPIHHEKTKADIVHVTIQSDSAMPSLRIMADNLSACFRQRLYSHLVALDIDISLARMTRRNDTIEDLYHLKSLPHRIPSSELTKALQHYLTRNHS